MTEETERKCKGCGIVKPIKEFALRTDQPGNRRWKCYQCKAEENTANYQSKKHLWKNVDGSWKKSSPESIAKSNAKKKQKYNEDEGFRLDHIDKAKRRRTAKRIFGDCPICGETPKAHGKVEHAQLVKDHCHQTGITRGWICQSCNLMLGHARDNPSILRK